MKKIAITVDSSCDVPVGFLEKNDISVFHINMLIGTEEYATISAALEEFSNEQEALDEILKCITWSWVSNNFANSSW